VWLDIRLLLRTAQRFRRDWKKSYAGALMDSVVIADPYDCAVLLELVSFPMLALTVRVPFVPNLWAKANTVFHPLT